MVVDGLKSRKLLVPLLPFPEGDAFSSHLCSETVCSACGFGEGMCVILGSGNRAPKLKGKGVVGWGKGRFANSMALTWLYKRGRARDGKRGQF